MPLRERLPVSAAAHLGAPLPILVHGSYYEGWHPADKPLREHGKEAFFAHVEAEAHAQGLRAGVGGALRSACSPGASAPVRSRT